MRILFDSLDVAYKSPFGTLQPGQSCEMHIRVPLGCGATGVCLMLEDCEQSLCGEFAFSHERDADGYAVWCGFLTLQTPALYYYWFRIDKSDGSFRLFRQGRDTNMEAGERWQVSVIPADFTTPEFAAGAVMYQIFPDRFARAGECDLTNKLMPFRLHARWDEEPDFKADAEGNWCSDFFGGNLNGIREKLPYLQELGVRILYLNPIFMAYSNHRYDTADYKRIDPMLGTEADFSALCRAAHERGMRVILDGVFSHTGSNSVYFDAKHVFGHGALSDPASPYRDWYRFRHYPDDYECWWNMPTLPNVEELAPGYLDYIIDGEDSVVAHWLRLGADGFRLDVVDEVPDAFVLRLKRRLRELKPEAFLIGEVWEDASNKRTYGVSRRYFVDGELDSTMNYPWREAILRFIGGQEDASDFCERVLRIAENYPPQVLRCVMNLLGTHDTPRILTQLGDPSGGSKESLSVRRLTRRQREQAVLKLRMAAFLQFVLPGSPCIYYGDEAGMEGYDDPFCRHCFPWGTEDSALTAYYRALAQLKNASPALRLGDISAVTPAKGQLHLRRVCESQQAEIYVNRSGAPWILSLSATPKFGVGVSTYGGGVALEPNSYAVFLIDR